MDRPSGVSSASEASWAESASSPSVTPVEGHELRRVAVAQRNCSGLVEQQCVNVASRLDGPARHREHVVLDQPVHSGNTDGREQSADRRWNQADEQRHEDE